MSQVFDIFFDITFYVCDKNLNTLIIRLEYAVAVEQFENNFIFMKLNQYMKCHLLVFGNNYEIVQAKIGEMKIQESNKQKLLDVIIDNNLNFNEYVFDLCKKN